mmetsp:Transcript_856/g.2122  ORF Transcript_856/g.2122 Transcript_856/m.2122 type:complete len:450 (-) Transcript_856:31-1380(-)
MFAFLRKGVRKTYDIDSSTIGRGSFAKVRRCVHRETGGVYAVKTVYKDRLKKHPEILENEIRIMKQVRHENCIAFHEMFEAQDKVHIIMELVTGGELLERVIENEYYSEREAANLFHQMARAVAYLHGIGVVHRDIKPQNVLYANPRRDSPIKLADFGLGKILDIHRADDMEHAMHTMCGTPRFVAPEMFARKGYGRECDIWSMGVILFILLSGDLPFPQELPQLLQFIARGDYSFEGAAWSEISEEAKNVIRRVLVVDPTQRYTAAQCLDDPWVQRFVRGHLSDAKLTRAQSNMREWRVIRKLKGAISAVVAVERLTDPRGPGLVSPNMRAVESKQILEELNLNQTVQAELRESFQMLDVGGSGRLEAHDLMQSVQAVGADCKAAAARLGGGSLSFDEYCVLMASHVPHAEASRVNGVFYQSDLQSAFQYFDLDRRGEFNKVVKARQL